MMQFKVVSLVFCALLSLAFSAPREGLPLLTPGGIGGIFEGPNDVTIIKGPDGSEITSEQKGGIVIREDGLEAQPIVVAELELDPILTEGTLSVSADPIVYSTGAPISASANQIIASPGPSHPTSLLTGETWAEPDSEVITGYEGAPFTGPSVINAKPIEIVQQDPHIIETEIINGPDIEPDQSSDLQGPSGRIITKGSASIVSGPASTTITEARKIIVAPPKLDIETPVIAEATFPLRELQAGLSHYTNTDAGPIEYGYSTTAAPLEDGLLGENVASTRINLGVNDLRQSIPVVEYSSLNGVINGPKLNDGSLSTTKSYYIVPAFLRKRQAPQNLSPDPQVRGTESSASYVQKIPKIGDSIAVDGRVDMGYTSYRKSYQLPHILGMALSRFYQKTPTQNTDIVIIDDKMGDLSQNEITSYDIRKLHLAASDLSQSDYIAPALFRDGIE